MIRTALLFVSVLVALQLQTACTPRVPAQEKTAASANLMVQLPDGKWVITDSNQTPLYDVFIYDNGPDYPAEGLIRVLKNGKIGYADAVTYTIVIEPQFDCAYPFENGKAKVSKHCQTVKDGEHSMWESEDWQYIENTLRR